MPGKKEGESRLWSIFNFIFLLFQVITGGVLIITIFKNNFAEISAQLYPEGGPLMGSYIAEILMQKWMAVIIGLVLISLIVKEYYIVSMRQRLLINFAFFIVLEGVAGLFVKLMFPVVFG